MGEQIWADRKQTVCLCKQITAAGQPNPLALLYTSRCDLQNKACSGLRQPPSVLEFWEVRAVEGQPDIRIFPGYFGISLHLQVPGSPWSVLDFYKDNSRLGQSSSLLPGTPVFAGMSWGIFVLGLPPLPFLTALILDPATCLAQPPSSYLLRDTVTPRIQLKHKPAGTPSCLAFLSPVTELFLFKPAVKNCKVIAEVKIKSKQHSVLPLVGATRNLGAAPQFSKVLRTIQLRTSTSNDFSILRKEDRIKKYACTSLKSYINHTY